MRYAMPRPGTIASALLQPYERHLTGLGTADLLFEFESAVSEFAAGESVSANCERVRLCRREMARRLFAPGLPAP